MQGEGRRFRGDGSGYLVARGLSGGVGWVDGDCVAGSAADRRGRQGDRRAVEGAGKRGTPTGLTEAGRYYRL